MLPARSRKLKSQPPKGWLSTADPRIQPSVDYCFFSSGAGAGAGVVAVPEVASGAGAGAGAGVGAGGGGASCLLQAVRVIARMAPTTRAYFI